MSYKYYLKLLSLPLLFLALSLTLRLGWIIFDLPSPEAMLDMVQDLFSRYGAVTIFLGAWLEGILLVGGYFPGVFIIFIGIIVSESLAQAAFFVFVGTIGLLLGHITNYVLGRYGWYKLLVKFGLKSSIEDSKENLIRRGPIAIFSSYWLPSLAALTDTAAGVIRMPFKTFIAYSVAGSVFWNTIVGVTVYLFNDFALSIAAPGSGGLTIVFLVIGIWIAGVLIADRRKRRVEGG